MSSSQRSDIFIEQGLPPRQLHLKFTKGFFKTKQWFLSTLSRTRECQIPAPELDNFLTRLILQVIVIWSLQQWNLLDQDPRYLITKFSQLEELGHSRYSSFLKDMFKVMQGDKTFANLRLEDHPQLGKIPRTGKVFFLVESDDRLWKVPLSNDAFFMDGFHVNLERSSTHELNVEPFPLLNFLASWQEQHGPIDGFLIGSILEYLDLSDKEERQARGKFYTPKVVAFHMVRKALESRLLINVEKHHFREKSSNSPNDSFWNHVSDPLMTKKLLETLLQVTILDPAVGSGHFLEAAARIMTSTFIILLQHLKSAALSSSLGTDWLNRTWNELTRHVFNQLPVESSTLVDRVNQHVELWLTNEETQLEKDFIKFVFLLCHVLPYTLHGVDISKEALQLTYIRLILLLLEHGSRYLLTRTITSIPLSPSDINLYHGNALIGTIHDNNQAKTMKRHDLLSSEKKHVRLKMIHQSTEQFSKRVGVSPSLVQKYHPLHWHLLPKIAQLPRIDDAREQHRSEGWFDLIIGNPPYVSSKTLPKEFKNLMKAIYRTARGQCDLFSLFMERSLQLARPHGIISFIIPDSFLDRSTFSPLRELLIKESTILTIHHVKNVFDDPTVANVIITFQKRKPPPHHHVNHATHESIEDLVTNPEPRETTPQQWFLTTRKHAFLLLPSRHRELVTKIQRGTRPLGEVIHIFRGEEMGKKSPLLKTRQCCSRCHPMLVGSDIQPFHLQFSGHYIHEDNIQKKGYFHPKIVIRQLGDRIHAALDHHGQYVTLQAVYNVILSPSSSLQPPFILALLNSHLMNYYYKHVFKQKRLFPRILIENIRDLPLMMPTPKIHDLICNLVQQVETRSQHVNNNGKNSTSATTTAATMIRARLEATIFQLYRFTTAEACQILTTLKINEQETRLILDLLKESSDDRSNKIDSD